MEYYFDTKFNERRNSRGGFEIDLLEIAIVCEDDRAFYAMNKEANLIKAWDNPHLREGLFFQIFSGKGVYGGSQDLSALSDIFSEHGLTNEAMQSGIRNLVGDDKDPVFYAYNGATDWVNLYGIFGSLAQTPLHFPRYYREIRYTIEEYARTMWLPVIQRLDDPTLTLEDAVDQIENLKGYPSKRRHDTQYSATAGAQWVKDLHEFFLELYTGND